MIEHISIRSKQDGAYIIDFIYNGYYQFRCYYGTKRWALSRFREEFGLKYKHIFLIGSIYYD